jgi:hypothetical protein
MWEICHSQFNGNRPLHVTTSITENPQITDTINKKTFKYNEKGDKGGSHLTKIRYMLYLVLVIP